MSSSSKRCVVGYYFSPDGILEAARRVRDRRFEAFDTFTPFPVHGMDEAMGLKRSWLPYVSFCAGVCGFSIGAFLTIWTHSVNWPIDVGGKSLFAWPAYIAIMFETTVLLTGIVTAIVMFTVALKLPWLKKPIFHPDISCDRFAIAIEVDNEQEIEPVKQFLHEIQAQDIHDVEGAL